jgi:hypothetical protein
LFVNRSMFNEKRAGLMARTGCERALADLTTQVACVRAPRVSLCHLVNARGRDTRDHVLARAALARAARCVLVVHGARIELDEAVCRQAA